MSRMLIIGASLLVCGAAWAAVTPEQKCQAGKNDTAGKLASCLAKAEKKFVTSGDGTKYTEAVTKCTDKFGAKWQKLEHAAVDASTTCPSTSDQSDIESFTGACNAAVADALAGNPLTPDLAAGNIRTGKTILGVAGTLTVSKSGQTTAYGTGSDGDVQAGSGLSYTDNGDGTITDNVTGLMWEKKDDSGGLHDKDNGYTWSGASYGGTNVMDGTIATVFLAGLNAGSGFAGHTDWRIPNARELQSIANYEIPYPGPVVDAAFHQSATCTGCMNVTAASCSCTASGSYWSSTTYRNDPGYAWYVYFSNVVVDANSKDGSFPVRAVRGGL